LTIRGAGVRFALFRRSAAGWIQDKRAANDEQPDWGSISATALSNSHLAQATWDGAILITETAAPDGPAVALSNPYAAEVLSLAFDPSGRLLAALVRPLAEDEIVAYEQAADPGEESSPKRARLADADPSCTVLLWDLALPGQAPTVLSEPRQVAAEPGNWAFSKVIAFSPDSNLLAADGADDSVRVWRLSDTGALPLRLPSHTSLISSLSFGADARLAVAGGFGELRVWDLRAPANSPAPGGGSATAAAYDPAGARLAVGDDKGTIQLWQTDRYDRKPIVLRGHDLQITQLIWAGGRLFSSSADGTVKAWIVETSELAGMVCSLVWRNLSQREWLEYVGPDLPYEAACPALPVPSDS
jgi:WD40 repeat protein